jgi:hypothetical protein
MAHPRISLAADVLAGKPVSRGTRLSVELGQGSSAGHDRSGRAGKRGPRGAHSLLTFDKDFGELA